MRRNSFLHKIGLANSPLCTFCKQESESLEHLLIICSCTKSFWSDFLTWSNQLNISLRDLSDSDILFVSYVHQLEKKLMIQITKLPIRKVNGKSFSYSAVVVRIKMQKKLISYFIVVIVPKQSLCQPLFMYSRKCILCTCSSILLV